MKQVTLDYLHANKYFPLDSGELKWLEPDKSYTVLDILNHQSWDAHEKIWAVTKHDLFFTDRQLRLFACDCAERGLLSQQKVDKQILKVVYAARDFANNKITILQLFDVYNRSAGMSSSSTNISGYARPLIYNAGVCVVATNAAVMEKKTKEERRIEREWQIELLKTFAMWEETL